MKREIFFVALIGLTLGLVGCAPSVVVENKTGFAVRVVVTSANGSEVVSPSPGESSSAEVAEGTYRVTVIPDAEWLDHAKATRKFLNDQLANSGNLTGAQLLDVIQRLKDIAARMQQFESTAGGGASCSGAVSSDGGGGVATITTAANGALVVACR